MVYNLDIRTPVLDPDRLLRVVSSSVLCDLICSMTLSCITSLKLSFSFGLRKSYKLGNARIKVLRCIKNSMK